MNNSESELNRQFRRVIREIPLGLSYWNGNLKNVFSNESFDTICNFGNPIKGALISEIDPGIYNLIKDPLARVLKCELFSYAAELQEIQNGKRVLEILIYPDLKKEKIKGFYFSILDVTSSYLAREEHEILATRLRLATSSAKMGVWDWYVDSNSMYWDDKMLNLYGISKNEFTGNVDVWMRGLHPEERDAVVADLYASLRGEKEWDTEFRILRPDGAIRFIKANGVVIRDQEGKPLRMLGINYDITEKRMAEAALKLAYADIEKRVEERTKELSQAREIAEKAAKARAKFLDIAAHELRTPVTVISMILQLAEGKQQLGHSFSMDDFARLKRSVARLSKLVFDLLDVSRLDKGILKLHKEQIDLVSLVDSIISDYRVMHAMRRIEWKRGEHSAPILGDQLRIYQVLGNLLDNAVKYSKADAEIKVNLEKLNNSIHIEVIDSGPAIPPAERADLFQPFFRGAGEQVRRSSGLGLGLSVCREIVALHGGNIGHRIADNGGNCFYFDLPQSQALDILQKQAS